MFLRAQQLQIQRADALQSVFEFAVIAQPLLNHGFLLGGEADLLSAAAGIRDCQDPDGMGATVGANGAPGAVTDAAVEQGAAEDFGGGRERGGELGAGIGDPVMFHS